MRRSTIVYLLIFVVMIGIYYYLNNRPESADIATPTETIEPVSYLFSAENGTPTSIRIESKTGEVVEVARNAENAWAVTLPTEASADQGKAEAAASQVTTMRILDSLSDIDPGVVGLDIPEYTMTVKFSNSLERIVQIGVLTPTEQGYYTRFAEGEILIVSRSAVDALIGLLDNPPYAATETPLPPTP